VAQLFTIGGLGIWTLVDLILILTGSFTDANGLRLRSGRKQPLDRNSQARYSLRSTGR
jgi:hypothetical protein